MTALFFILLSTAFIFACFYFSRENRYALFLTENYAALDILKNPKNYLSDDLLSSQPGASQPFILFGSSFPKDKEFTQVISNIS